MPGVDYYLNARNWDALDGIISCDPSMVRCDALFFIALPH
jgi:hypothetical protein